MLQLTTWKVSAFFKVSYLNQKHLLISESLTQDTGSEYSFNTVRITYLRSAHKNFQVISEGTPNRHMVNWVPQNICFKFFSTSCLCTHAYVWTCLKIRGWGMPFFIILSCTHLIFFYYFSRLILENDLIPSFFFFFNFDEYFQWKLSGTHSYS